MKGNVGLELLDSDVLEGWSKDVETLLKLLNAYQPKTQDGSPHDEVAAVAAQFIKLAADHKAVLDDAYNESLVVAARVLKQQQAHAKPGRRPPQPGRMRSSVSPSYTA